MTNVLGVALPYLSCSNQTRTKIGSCAPTVQCKSSFISHSDPLVGLYPNLEWGFTLVKIDCPSDESVGIDQSFATILNFCHPLLHTVSAPGTESHLSFICFIR